MKKILITIALFLVGYVLPLFVYYLCRDPFVAKSIQNIILGVLFLNSGIVIYLNLKDLQKEKAYKWWRWGFAVIAMLVAGYSGALLLLIYSLRHCCSI